MAACWGVSHTFMLQALPSLSDLELPPAVGLILKLSSESEGFREAVVHAVRSRVREHRASTTSGTLDAVRLAVNQHPGIAAAMLADIDAECRSSKAAAAEVCQSLLQNRPPTWLWGRLAFLPISNTKVLWST